MPISNRNAVELNGVKYPLAEDGQVHPILVSKFADKQVVGDYSLDSDPQRSIWVISNDLTGGMGVEEVRRSEQVNKYWFGTSNTEWVGHQFLPYLTSTATTPTITASALLDGGLEAWREVNTPTYWTKSSAGNVTTTRNTANVYSGTYCAQVRFDAAGEILVLHQHITWTNEYRGEYFTFKIRGAGSASNKVRIAIYDGVTRTYSSYNTGTDYNYLTVTKQLGQAATELTLECYQEGAGAGAENSYWDAAEYIPPTTGVVKHWADFNSHLWVALHNNLYRLNESTGSAFMYTCSFPAAITKLTPTANNTLMISLGDTENYWYLALTTSSATLAEELDNSETGVDVSDGTQFAVGDIIKIDSEEMLVTAIATNTLTVVRDYLDTSAATHTNRSTITVLRFTQTNVSDNSYAVHWDSKAHKVDSTTGAFSFTATPNSATPTWTPADTVDVASVGSIRNMTTYFDADYADVVYLATTKGVLTWDATADLWLNTQLKVPEHTDNGKGFCSQAGNLYYSSGLSVYEYNLLSGSASIRDIGLPSMDGIQESYRGTIVHLFPGYETDVYALVDASAISASNYSTMHKWNGRAWYCVWADSSPNTTPNVGTVSPVYAYRRWWGVGSTIYYQSLDRAKSNPLKTTTSYAASSLLLSPWFDAGWYVGDKVALASRAFASGTSATETVTIKYRTNRTNTDLGTGWTTLDTLVAADNRTESRVVFNSNLGTIWNAIQFRVDLARGGTATNTPDLQYLILEYEKVLGVKWGWQFTVDLTQPWVKAPSKLLEALISAASSQTLVSFYHDATQRYVRVTDVVGTKLTGDTYVKGMYNVTVVEK